MNARPACLLEVVLAFVVVHVGFRAVKHFTAIGQLDVGAGLNFTPGTVMILFTLGVLLLCGRSFAAYGLTLAGWGENVKLGLVWGLLLVAGAALLRLLGVRHLPGATPPTMVEGVIYALAVVVAFVSFGWLLSRPMVLRRVPAMAAVLAFFLVLCVPLVVALVDQRPFGHTLLTVLWLVVGAGCGEEVFYRGYIQSRVNEEFGRPFRLFGAQFGAGLVVSSILFGFLHALNSVDYFQGRFTFAWGFGIANICTGLLYGFLRESSGSVVAPVLTHATLDVLVIVPGLISGR
jgi:membrane protease YdiL (CAAX protease family)